MREGARGPGHTAQTPVPALRDDSHSPLQLALYPCVRLLCICGSLHDARDHSCCCWVFDAVCRYGLARSSIMGASVHTCPEPQRARSSSVVGKVRERAIQSTARGHDCESFHSVGRVSRREALTPRSITEANAIDG